MQHLASILILILFLALIGVVVFTDIWSAASRPETKNSKVIAFTLTILFLLGLIAWTLV